MATTKSVLILARYSIKATGSVVLLVRNGNNHEYFVTVNANGTSGCIQANGEACPSSKGKHKCYHIANAIASEQARAPKQLDVHPALLGGMTEREVAIADVVREHVTAFVPAQKLKPTQAQRENAPLNGNRAFSLLR